ncbi:MAG: MFS transporter [Planctomycetaceae bacterium]|nr:MFS transporter [Planctomycetaceae bacterium]
MATERPEEELSSTPTASGQDSAAMYPGTSPASEGLVERTTDSVFVLAFIANLILVIANASLFVFADWIRWLHDRTPHGGPWREQLAGNVVQVGLIMAITGRLFLGRSIDRFGVRRVWLTMCVLAITAGVLFLTATRFSIVIYLARMMYATGLAGMFTCSAFHIQSQVATHRRTEFLALLGSSGFLGMIGGTQLAQYLLRSVTRDGGPADRFYPLLFQLVLGCLLIHGAIVIRLTWRDPLPSREVPRPTLLVMMRRHWPGMTMLVAMVMGTVFTVPSLYLKRFATHQGLSGIAVFWTVYAITALCVRVASARASQNLGRHRMILIGLTGQGVGLLALVPVQSEYHVIPAAILCGIGHAFLFPSMVSLGSGRFPPEYRGSGTNLTLGFLDLGSALSAPMLGWIIDLRMFSGVGFRPMFTAAGLVALSVAALWYFTHRDSHDHEETGAAN